ncbi:MAG: helix-turn-helix transcriptional regulator [Vicinamibacterales bacterium]
MATLDSASLLQLIDLTYRTVFEPDAWQAFVHQFNRALESEVTAVALLHEVGGPDDRGEVKIWSGDPAYATAFNEHYYLHHPYNARVWDYFLPGSVALGQAMCPEADVVKTRFYDEWMRPQGILHGMLVPCVGEPGNVLGLGTYRSATVGRFEEAEERFVQQLVPHVARALEIAGRARTTEHRANSFAEVLDRGTHPLFVTDRDGHVLHASQGAERLCKREDGLLIRDGQLCASRPDESSALRRAIGESAARRCDVVANSGATVRLSRPSGSPPLRLAVFPLGPHVQAGKIERREASVAVFVDAPEAPRLPSRQQLQECYGLTAAQARLAHLLVSGASMAQAVKKLGISINTVKSHMRVLFDKTETNRQAALVGVLARVAGWGDHS